MPKVNKNKRDKESLKRVQAYLATEHGYCSKDLNKEPEKFSPKVVKTEPSDVQLNKKCSRKDIFEDYEVIIEQPGHSNNEESEVFLPDNIVQFNGDEPLMDPISFEVKTEPLDDEVETPVISDIIEHPLGYAPETPLHPKAKRRRTSRQKSSPAPAPCLPSSSLPSTSTAVSSSATNVKCSSSEATSSPASEMKSPAPPPQPRHTARNNIGSDEDTDESDGEDMLVLPIIPRVFRSTLRTPLDQDLDSDDEDIAAKPASSCDLVLKADEYEFDWRLFPEVPIAPQSRREPFSQTNVGPTTPLVDPYDIFVAIWDRGIMEHIASETNRYAQEVAARMFEESTLGPNSRISRWQDTTVDELYVFFAIILAMGIVIKSRTEEYWTANTDIFYTPGFSAHMSYNRFIILSQCLHFNNNVKLCALKLGPSEARVFKIQPIMTHLNLKFSTLYIPSQNIVVDESILMWSGWLDASQLTTNKRMKTYELCESKTGYLWRFELHISQPQNKDSLDALIPSIVLRLTEGLEHKGYTVWMDSYYNSPSLARCLKSLGFDCAGTLRTNREHVPQALHNLTKYIIRKGEICGFTSGDVDVMVWRDNHMVGMISTYHGNGVSQVRSATKPVLINDFNAMMVGVDKKDQMLATYPIERKRTKVWYKKLFRRLLNISVLNAYVIHRHSSNCSHRNFRISLVKSLLSKHGSPTSIVSSSALFPRPVDVSHRVAQLPIRSSQRLRRFCVVCKKLISTQCVGCDKTVCMEPCFLTLHLKPT